MEAQPREAGGADAHHLVAFYDGDGHLTASVAAFLGRALLDGDAAAILATADHRRQLTTALEAEGLHVHRLVAEGRLILVDAASTLTSVLHEGRPDRDRLRRVVCDLVEPLSADGRRVRVYGEMVSLLWADGAVDAAIELEAHWDALAVELDFDRLCGYPMRRMRPAGSEAFLAVCEQHAVVLPHEGFDGGPDWPARHTVILATGSAVPADAEAIQEVRQHFVSTVVEELRSGILERGEALLADARRTIESIDSLLGAGRTQRPLT